MILCSKLDGWHYNAVTQQFIDIDLLFEIQLIKEIGYDAETQNFYILANKCRDRYGIYLIRFSALEP